MASILLDITTRGLDEAIFNVKNVRNLITAGTAKRMEVWYNQVFKRTALKIIESGEGMAPNKEPYATWKLNNKGIDHPLGRLSGALYFSVSVTKPVIKETRGKEVRLAVDFSEPYYIAYVVQGTSNHVGRDFITIARDKDWRTLLSSVGSMFNRLDFTKPYPELLSTVMGPSDLPSLTGHYVER